MTTRCTVAITGTLVMLMTMTGCQSTPPSLDLDRRGGWVEGNTGYCVTGQSQYSQLNAHAGWLETYAEEDYLLLGGHESQVGYWLKADVEHIWAIGELRGYVADHELITSREQHTLAGAITCVSPRYP